MALVSFSSSGDLGNHNEFNVLNHTQVEVCVIDKTIKNARGGGGGGVKCVFDFMDERHIKVCLHERVS